MGTVKQRIAEISQPLGGFLNPNTMEILAFDDAKCLYSDENLHPTTIGMVVDYMTRFLTGVNINTAFQISIRGAINKADILNDDSVAHINAYLIRIDKLPSELISLVENSIICIMRPFKS